MRSIAFVLIGLVFLSTQLAADWPQFRGPNSGSVAASAKLPTDWSDGKNVAWKVDVPGKGVSGPIVVGGRVFVTSDEGARQQMLNVFCFDAESGEQIWRRTFWATGRTATHPTSANAAPTPASDGERVFAFFSSNDLICLDLDGNLQWYRGLAYDYPKAGNDIGMSSSPVVSGGTVVVQIENQGDSFAAGIDTKTGETRWRMERPTGANWSSPVVLPASGKRGESVLLQSHDGLTAVEPLTGEVLWRYETQCSGIPSSLMSDGWLLVPSNGITALKLSDESNSPELAWDENRLRPGSPSPVAHDGKVYVLASGVLKCGDLASGDVLWQLRLAGQHWATPVIAGEHLYAINADGTAHVVKLGEKGELAATNEFGQGVMGTPAIVGNAMFVRTKGQLWKIASP